MVIIGYLFRCGKDKDGNIKGRVVPFNQKEHFSNSWRTLEIDKTFQDLEECTEAETRDYISKCYSWKSKEITE